jgi:O-antigen/teichoic acid export membrane protein
LLLKKLKLLKKKAKKRSCIASIYSNLALVIPNLFGNVLAKLSNAVLTFTAIVILSRLLGAEGNGYFSLFIANASLFVLVIGLGLENAITYFIAQKTFPSFKIINSGILYALVQSFICIVITYGIGIITNNHLLTFSDTVHSQVWQWLFIFVFFLNTFLTAYLNAIFNGDQQFAIVNKATKYVQLTTIIVLVFAGKTLKKEGGNNFLISVYIAVQSIGPMYLLHYYFTKINPRHLFTNFLNWSDLKPVVRFGLFALFINLVQFLAYRADLWILEYYNMNKAQIGIYALSQKLITMYWMVPTAIASITFPMLSRMENLTSTLLTKTVKVFMQVWFYISILSVIIGPFLISLFFGKEFKESTSPFVIILPGALLFVFNILLAPYFSSKNLLKKNFITSLICLIIIIILDLILIPKFGLEGSAIASSVGYAAAGIIALYNYCIAENLPISSFFKRSKNIMTDIRTTIIERR